jgi:hypothetical protein
MNYKIPGAMWRQTVRALSATYTRLSEVGNTYQGAYQSCREGHHARIILYEDSESALSDAVGRL